MGERRQQRVKDRQDNMSRDERQEKTNQLKNSAKLQNIETMWADGSDAYANKGFVVEFQHVPSGKMVSFKAFIMAFNETYSPNWAEETVYGRADPIYMFKNTTRSISLALKVPAATEGEAFINMSNVQSLIQFLYPSYADVKGAQTIAQSPLIRLKVMNIIAARQTYESNLISRGTWHANYEYENSKQGTFDAMFKSGAPKSKKKNAGTKSTEIAAEGGTTTPSLEPDSPFIAGALGVIKNLSVNHNVENPDAGVFEFAYGTIMPKWLELNLDFGVIHEHALGWDGDGDFSNPWFPYGINSSENKGNKAIASGLQASTTEKSRAQRQELRKQEQAEQAKENAKARYAGAMAGSRMGGDERRQDRTERRAMRTVDRLASAEGSRREERLDTRLNRQIDSWQAYEDMQTAVDADLPEGWIEYE